MELWDGKSPVRTGKERVICPYCTRAQKSSALCMKCGANLHKPALNFNEMVSKLKLRPIEN